jgi:hypothetical protein
MIAFLQGKSIFGAGVCNLSLSKGVFYFKRHPVQQARQRLVRHGCSRIFAANDIFNANTPHQACNGAARNIKAFPAHLAPDFAHAQTLRFAAKTRSISGLGSPSRTA